jgi:predicted amino acid-binding ACT domain protein
MIILDKPRPFTSPTIRIPLYHRGHLSLFEGAKVWLCLLPGIGEGNLSELIVTPIQHDAWSDLWRISLTLKDRVGLVHDVFRILADKDINIITAESSSREGQTLHSIEIIASAKLYTGSYNDGTHEQRSIGDLEELPELRREILSHMIDDMAFLSSGQPRFRIRRVRHLLNARRIYNNLNEQRGRQGVRPLTREAIIGKTGRDVTVTLPEEVQDRLFRALNTIDKTPNGNYLMVSNTTDRFLRIYFIPKGTPIIAPTIEHQDDIGALAAITAALQNADFNILTSLSRLYQWGALARTEFVLQPPNEIRNLGEEEIKGVLEKALSTPTLVRRYSVGIDYPSNYQRGLRIKKLECGTPDSEAQQDEPLDWRRPPESILNSRYRELAQRVAQADAKPEDIWKYQVIQTLVNEQKTVAEIKQPRQRGVIFISYGFGEQKLFVEIEKEAKRQHFSVITGRDLSGAPRNRDGIIDLIRRCTHFLGVWTEAGGLPVASDLYVPSPWLGWELGVSDALGKRWHLLISNRIHPDAWKRIAAETPHSIYEPATLDRQIKNAIRTLSSTAK